MAFEKDGGMTDGQGAQPGGLSWLALTPRLTVECPKIR